MTYELLLKVLQTQAEAEKMHEVLEALIHEASGKGIVFAQFMEITGKHFIQHVIEKNHGNRSRAARELGMHRNTLNTKERKYGIQFPSRSKKPISSQVAKGMKVSA